VPPCGINHHKRGGGKKPFAEAVIRRWRKQHIFNAGFARNRLTAELKGEMV